MPPADDVEFGHVVDLTLGEPSGTELVADAAIGATTLTVDYAGDFEDTGEVTLNGVVLPYTEIAYGDAATDPDVITLAAPLAAAAVTDDKVVRMAGGEQVADWLLHVSLGDGHPVDIDIPFEQRAMWSTVDPSVPVPVLVSSDLERLVEVPARAPSLDQAAVETPFIDLYRTADVSWADTGTTFAPFTTWLVQAESAMSIASGDVTPEQAGLYLLVLTVRWAGNSSGRRVIRLVSTIGGVDTQLKAIPASPPDADPYTQQAVVIHRTIEGETFRAEARQTSGAALDLLAVGTSLQIVRLQA